MIEIFGILYPKEAITLGFFLGCAFTVTSTLVIMFSYKLTFQSLIKHPLMAGDHPLIRFCASIASICLILLIGIAFIQSFGQHTNQEIVVSNEVNIIMNILISALAVMAFSSIIINANRKKPIH